MMADRLRQSGRNCLLLGNVWITGGRKNWSHSIPASIRQLAGKSFATETITAECDSGYSGGQMGATLARVVNNHNAGVVQRLSTHLHSSWAISASVKMITMIRSDV